MKANKFWISFLACFVVIVLLGGIAVFAIPSLQTRLTDSIVEKSQMYKDVCDENDNLKTELRIKNLEYTNTVSRLNTAQTSLTNEIALNAQLSTQLANAITEKTILQSSLNDKDADIQVLNAQITAKNSEIASIQTLLDDSNTRITDLENYIADLENQVISLNLEIARFDEIRGNINNMTIRYLPEFSHKQLYFYNNPERTGTFGGILDSYYYSDTKKFSQTYQGYVLSETLTHLDYGYGFYVMDEVYYSLFDNNHSVGFLFGDFIPMAQDCDWQFNRIYLNGELVNLDVIKNVIHSITYAMTLDFSYNNSGEVSNVAVNIFATNDGSQPIYID